MVKKKRNSVLLNSSLSSEAQSIEDDGKFCLDEFTYGYRLKDSLLSFRFCIFFIGDLKVQEFPQKIHFFNGNFFPTEFSSAFP